MKRATIQDIAREAGVGKSTVSRVVSGKGYVSQEAEEKVREVMKRLQYHPNAAAQNLSRNESDTIGLILPEINNPFFSGILSGVSRVVEKYKSTLLLASSENQLEKDLRALEAMCRQRVRGLIYIPAVDYENEEDYNRLSGMLDQLGCPVVVLDRPLPRFSLDSVTTDNYGGAYACAEALIEAGHRRIGIVAGDMDIAIGRERYEGFCRALSQHGLSLREEDVLYGQFSEETTYQKVKTLLETGRYPRAFFVSNNLGAAGFLKAVYEKGLQIPKDVSVVSFDKLSNQEIFGLPLSYLERNVQEMGEQSARLLFKRFDLPEHPPEHAVVVSKVVLLGSERKM